MARITKVFASGSLGNVIFYEWKGKPCARSKPATVRQTGATIRSANRFGKAKKLSRFIRAGLAPVFSNHKKRELMYRFDNIANQWLLQAETQSSSLENTLAWKGLECNYEVSFAAVIRKNITVNWEEPGKAVITIPPLIAGTDLVAPAATVFVSIVFASASCDIINFMLLHSSEHILEVHPGSNQVGDTIIELAVSNVPGSLSVIAASLRYTIERNGSRNLLQEEKWLPVVLLDASYKEE